MAYIHLSTDSCLDSSHLPTGLCTAWTTTLRLQKRSLLRPNIVRQNPTDSTLTDNNLGNKGDLDEATSLSRFWDMTFRLIFPKFVNLTCIDFINIKPSDFVNSSRNCLSLIFNNFMNATLKQPDKYAILKKFFQSLTIFFLIYYYESIDFS